MGASVLRQATTDLIFSAKVILATYFRRTARAATFLALALLGVPVEAQQVEWSVDNPYPFFRDAESWNNLKPNEQDAGSFEAWRDRLFAKATRDGALWPESSATQWDAKNEAFDQSYLEGGIAITLWLNNAPAGDCQWSNTGDATADATRPCEAKVAGIASLNKDFIVSVVLPNGRKIEQPIRAQREIILGLGDSYSSGEGNPDIPVRFAQVDLRNKGAHWYKTATRASNGFKHAVWLDERCHRSLYSYQNLAAMWRAAQNPHKAVYFIPLACSGAEIWDGMLVPQKKPPGGNHATNRLSQLHAARKVLGCANGNCDYKPDTVFLSIGGNDVFFSALIKAALIPNDGRNPITAALIPLLRNAYGLNAVLDDANVKLVKRKEMHQQIAYMLEQFGKTGIFAQQPTLVVTGYPDLLRQENGNLCASACPSGAPYSESDPADPDTRCRSSMNSALHHVQGFSSRWQFRILGEKGDDQGLQPGMSEQNMLYEKVLHHLKRELNAAYIDSEKSTQAFKLHWIDPPNDVRTHGICAVTERNTNSPRNELDWPRIGADGNLGWQPYQPHQRWFRTPNDAYLTQGELAGSFHPSAQYHSALARKVVCVLDNQPRESCE